MSPVMGALVLNVTALVETLDTYTLTFAESPDESTVIAVIIGADGKGTEKVNVPVISPVNVIFPLSIITEFASQTYSVARLRLTYG